ncbi:leucine-rich repeat protein [Companilactobacillus kedongensis]|uniref:leucine-rich repeat protein n=1 Tax=Companilactobacillus kedongensis TaxID=2486004 RepID=UPI000F7A1197|nr:leucine-rich repeat protein [Companilactobacillus kedongensis]
MREKSKLKRNLLLTSATLVGLGTGLMLGTNVKADSTDRSIPSQVPVENDSSILETKQANADQPATTGDKSDSSIVDTGDSTAGSDTSDSGTTGTGVDSKDNDPGTTDKEATSDPDKTSGSGDTSTTETTDPVTAKDNVTDPNTDSQSDLSYSQDANGNYIVTGYTGAAQKTANGEKTPKYSTDITIPDYYKGMPVIAIAANAFNNDGDSDDNLSVVDGLTSVTLGKNLQWIGNGAFEGNKLTSISFTDGIWSIGVDAFKNNELVDVDLNQVAQINSDAFSGNDISKVVIPDKTTNIAENAFKDNKITDLTLGKNLETVGTSAFENNQIAGTIVLPDKLAQLGDYVFANNKITGIKFNGLITKMNTGVFENNNLKGSLVLPDNVVNIGDESFANNQLDDLTLNSDVVTIGTNSFTNNNLSGTLTIPKSVASIGNSSFANNNLTGIILDGDLDSLGDKAFSANNLQSVKINGKIGTIGNEAFSDQKKMAATVYATYTKALGVRAAIAKNLGLSSDQMTQLKFSMDGSALDYDEYSDQLTIPNDYRGQNVTVTFELSSGGLDTGWYGTRDLKLTLVKKMVTADVNIPSNLADQPWVTSVVKNVTGQVGTDVTVDVPEVLGYIADKKTIQATVNDNGTITANESVDYEPDFGPHEDPTGPTDPTKPTTPDDPVTPITPVTPTTSVTPVTPVTPTDPATPNEPVNPGKPDIPKGGSNSTGTPDIIDPSNNSSSLDSASSEGPTRVDIPDNKTDSVEPVIPNTITAKETVTNATPKSGIITSSSNGSSNTNITSKNDPLITFANNSVQSNNIKTAPSPSDPVSQETQGLLPQTSNKSTLLGWIGAVVLVFLGWLGFKKKDWK